jgi:hypothetical protein
MSSSAASNALVRPSRPVHKKTKGKSQRRTELSRPGAFAAQEAISQPVFPLRDAFLNKVYGTVQTTSATVTLTSSAVANTFGYVSFTLALLDQVNQWTSVFDQYRVRMMEVTFRPRMTQESVSTANTGLFTTVIDVDDSALLTTIGQANDYATALTGRGLDNQRRTLVPHVAMAAYSGAFTSFVNDVDQWIDAASTGVIHYGVKTAWTITDVAYSIDTTTRVWVEFRNVR